ncbi:MAG: Ycf51 family protein [Synechococcaceae cyanobacterium]|nr:Ycf51 family protein [Synechococcaceae cyanobacterium]
MAADPILFVAGTWLGAASGLLALVTIAAFLARWGVRFRLVGITSFTALLAVSSLAFAISYTPRVTVPGAVRAPVVYDNGGDLVIAAAPAGITAEALQPTIEQVARNLRGSGRAGDDGWVHVRLRTIEPGEPKGASRPRILAAVRRNLASGVISPE